MSMMSVEVPEILTERLRLRAPRLEDLDAEREFFASDRSKGVGGPFPPEQVFRSMASFIGHWFLRGYGFWAVEDRATGEYYGRVGPWFPEGWPEPEIGWTVMGNAEGKGIAREAAVAARAFMYDHRGWTTVISLISHDNDRSIALAKRVGCIQEPDYEHPTYGPMTVWRHPSATALAAEVQP